MPEQLLNYLTRPNPTVVVESTRPPRFTYNVAWTPIENIKRWDEFNYQTLARRFRTELDRQVTLPDFMPQCQNEKFNRLYDETMLEHLVVSLIILHVSSALPSDLFLVGGAATWQTDACYPDWGAGKIKGPRNDTQRPKAVLLGDTKYRWSHQVAIDVIYYGELFCRVPDCVRAQKKYTSTNNLRTHLLTHDGVKLEKGLVGGRVHQKEIDEAIRFYKSLFAGTEPKPAEDSTSSTQNASSATPILPKKKDGTVHVTNMRKKVVEFGHKVPCDSCGKRSDCCKDVNKCAYFILFNCGSVCPSPASQVDTAGETDAEA
ncbi:conserved hypothetical protein [Aspergillus udagawae]|uniref:C2H2-type domain-containing protein n=1 Tax=Aspergillus udagawae TaxID=91492 RepID=A0ABQ1BCA7_9EURO|nr:conserved hypothetical protein [Aspergillus udagawae]